MIFAAATATQANVNDHFQLTLVIIGAGLAAVGWIIRHMITQSSQRHDRVDEQFLAMDKTIDDLCEELARVKGSLEARRWWQR